eukprot:366350-Chlamydomonas_euryale.AAC.15
MPSTCPHAPWPVRPTPRLATRDSHPRAPCRQVWGRAATQFRQQSRTSTASATSTARATTTRRPPRSAGGCVAATAAVRTVSVFNAHRQGRLAAARVAGVAAAPPPLGVAHAAGRMVARGARGREWRKEGGGGRVGGNGEHSGRLGERGGGGPLAGGQQLTRRSYSRGQAGREGPGPGCRAPEGSGH